MKITKYKITNKEPMHIWVRDFSKGTFEQLYLLRADEIEFINNHLLFYIKKELVFKVWLKEGKWQKCKNIQEAIKLANMKID
jgi:hypothetical protein